MTFNAIIHVNLTSNNYSDRIPVPELSALISLPGSVLVIVGKVVIMKFRYKVFNDG